MPAYQRHATAAMIQDTPLVFDLPAVRRKKLTADFEGGDQSSDAGLLLMREAERRYGVCRRLANAMLDRRDQSRIRHAMFELVMARASAIACGHADGNDPFRWLMASYGTLKNLNAEPVRIDEIGRVWRVTMKGGGRTV